MHFFLHPSAPEALAKAFAKQDHKAHRPAELEPPAGTPENYLALPAALLPLLAERQWHLVTCDGTFIRTMYEQKVEFPRGLIVHLLDPAADPDDAVSRLFERYPRLTAKRLYTITASRVKIRQLPGMA